MRIILVALCCAATLETAQAQAVMVAGSVVESGWTSNASDGAGGEPDLYLRQAHELSLSGVVGPLSLRAGLTLEQQVFRQHRGENDLSVGAGIEAGLALAEGMTLRLGYALTREWIGDMLDLGPARISILTPLDSHEMLGELTIAGAGGAVSLGVDLSWQEPGLSEFAGLPLPPARIEPYVLQVTARADGEWVLSPELTGLARLHWRLAAISEAERAAFGREPAGAVRLAGGLALLRGGFSAQARLGMDMAWAQAAPHLAQYWPYLDAGVELAVNEALVLNARLFAGLDIENPADGVASRRIEAELGASLAISPALTLSLGLAASREQGLYDPSRAGNRQTISSALALTLGPGLEARLAASHARVEEPGAAYPVTTLGLGLNGKV